MVCTRLPHPSRLGVRQSAVWTVRAGMGAIGTLGRQLARDGDRGRDARGNLGATTRPSSTSAAISATTSGRSKRSGSPSPSPEPR